MRNAPILRTTMDPTPENGLRNISQIQIDRIVAAPRERVGTIIGHLNDATMLKVNRSLAAFTGIA